MPLNKETKRKAVLQLQIHQSLKDVSAANVQYVLVQTMFINDRIKKKRKTLDGATITTCLSSLAPQHK